MVGLNKYKAYPEYKDSGVEWLGEIPYQWKILRHKYVACFSKGKNPMNLLDQPLKNTLPYLSMDCLRNNTTDKYALISNDVRITLEGQPLIIWDGSNAGEFVKGKSGILSSTMAAATLTYPLHPQYYWYLCISIEPEIRRNATGMGIPHVNGEELKSIKLGIPSIFEQSKIAAFLDHETTKIDKLIEKQQQLIELLKEKCQAVISHAVTKGLNLDAPMKDSGVEWLGEVPTHWISVRVKQISSFITSGPRGWSDFLTEEGREIFLQSGDLNDELGLQLDKAKRVSPPKNAEGIRTRLTVGDVVVCITGANTGRVAIVSELSQTTYINQHLSLIRPNTSNVNSVFLGYSLASSVGRSFFDVAQYGLKEGLSLSNVSEAPLALPPRYEQDAIVKYLESIRNNYDNLSRISTVQVELLKERRTALISAAVTGKIDVRDWVAPEAREVEVLQEVTA
ncbi:TPA: restriction endonuclease subunit S [Yersinia enterocolitica]|uniref:restriction endonuclease subunit S n=1 Tax=Yersinia enterocolitica TaxID=630 RepID=UPI000978A21F|nr:restriction endonuclease subunit S [Yersinia enterocolitica]HEN3621391.1 restriction endonuclease subunit S [Yersinia enterocolitica]HEN3624807.1 restriction endonuclease subunit S [Yersinia enterocolitica]HEO0718627.1 restriction endonuclease subunit S [Yersinia enterocolitica]